jgi:hypothetical protein
MASIHGITCTFIRGEIPSKKLRTRTWAVPGINSIGALTMGYGEAQFEVRAIFYATAGVNPVTQLAEARAWVGLIEARQGTIGTIVTDLATAANCLITKVGTPQVQRCHPYGFRVELVVAGELR